MKNKSNFKVLSDAEHMLTRPGMYIGSTTGEKVVGLYDFMYKEVELVPGLLKIINEIIDNSVDEFIRTDGKFASKISISIDQNPLEPVSITVSDDGRGMPHDLVNGVPIPVAAWTSARSGSNFTDDRSTIGMNGVGSFATAVFSTKFIGSTTNSSGNTCIVEASDNCSSVEHRIVSKKAKPGTCVQFWPDLSRFGVMDFSEDHILVIKDRLMNLAICFPGITFTFNDEKIKIKNLKDISSRLSDNNHTLEHIASDRRIQVIVAPNSEIKTATDTSDQFLTHSYVNGLYTRLGGSHIEFISNKIIVELRAQIKKKYKFDVSPAQIKSHLFVGMWITGVNNLKFDSQTKERVTNTTAEMASFFDGMDLEKFTKKILSDENIIMPIVEAQIRKAELAELAEIRKKNKDADKANLRKISKFTDASDKRNRRDCMLFITEGDSANASILSAKTPQIGAFPLRGKPLNALGVTMKDILQNQEISNLFSILGLKIGEKVRSRDYLYFGKIVLCTDADVDGSHISGLIMATLYRFWPELFDLGVIYRFKTPIAKTIKGGKDRYFYSMDEFREYCDKNKSSKVRYLKGLGSSSADDFRFYFSEMDKNLVDIGIDSIKDLGIIDLVFGKEAGATDKRKNWLGLEAKKIDDDIILLSKHGERK